MNEELDILGIPQKLIEDINKHFGIVHFELDGVITEDTRSVKTEMKNDNGTINVYTIRYEKSDKEVVIKRVIENANLMRVPAL